MENRIKIESIRRFNMNRFVRVFFCCSINMDGPIPLRPFQFGVQKTLMKMHSKLKNSKQNTDPNTNNINL